MSASRSGPADLDPLARLGMAELLRTDPEAWSSVSGMLAMLALPAIGYRVPAIAVELEGEWRDIHDVRISATEITFVNGVNGHSRQWSIPLFGGMPRWLPGSANRPEVAS